MSEKPTSDVLNRRRFLGAAGLGAAGLAGAGSMLPSLAAKASEAAKPDPAITEIKDWNRYLGDGVDKRPYGVPSKFEKDVIRRDVHVGRRPGDSGRGDCVRTVSDGRRRRCRSCVDR